MIVEPEGILPSQLIGVELLHTKLLDYLASSEPQLHLVLINGGAGAGKSWTTINGLIPTCIATLRENNSHINIAMTTTTHQANGVIEDEIRNAGYGIGVSTIHSYLGLTPWTGTCITNPSQFRDSGYKLLDTMPLYAQEIIFVDEAYRICPKLWAIMCYLRPNVLWVATYDPFQTPPVGYNSSPIHDEDVPRCTFKESPRFANSGDLAQLVIDLKNTVEHGQGNYKEVFESHQGKAYALSSYAEFGKEILPPVMRDEPLDKNILMVCGTRKAACKLNNSIHRKRRDNNYSLFRQEDPITVEYVVGDQNNFIVSNLRKDRLFPAEVETLTGKETKIDCLKKFGLLYKIPNRSIYLVPIFESHSSAPFKLNKAVYKEGIILIGIRLNYVRTVHTAQGMTVPNVYIDYSSIMAWSSHDMRRRLLYTGASRCSGRLKVV